MLNPDDLSQINFSESQQRLITYLKSKYIEGNTYDVQIDRQLYAVLTDKENRNYQLLKTCVVSGDPKLLMGFMKLIALAYLPEAKEAISTGSVTFHEADENDSDKDWLEFNASNIYRPTVNLIRKAFSETDCFNTTIHESSIPFWNCSISARTTIEKLIKLFEVLLKTIPANQVFDELLHSVDSTYQLQDSYAEVHTNIPSNK